MNKLLLFAHLAVAIFMVLAFLTAVISTPTERQPSGEAGLYAPVMAIGVGTLLLLNRTRFGGSRGKLIRELMVIAGSMGSAVLWLADAAETHVTNWKLWSDFGLALSLVAILALMALGLILMYRADD